MLNGWKAIAAYLKREERTAMRWAKERGLPVHRTPGPGRGSIYALPAEIDSWLASTRDLAPTIDPVPEPEIPETVPALPPLASHQPARWRRIVGARRWISATLAAVACLVLTGVVLAYHRPAATPPVVPDAEIADPVARAAFLQASYDWNLRTRESLTRAVHEYGEVIERDPRTSAAYVGLANSYLLLREDGAMADSDAYPRAEAAARAAAALSPTSAAPHRALAFVDFWSRQDVEAARLEFSQALALDPNDPLTHHWYATALSANGEHEAALREIVRSRELDPTSNAVIADQGLLAFLAGHQDEGVAMLRSIEHEQPQAVAPHRALADIAMWSGQPAEYLRERLIVDKARGDDVALHRTQRLAAARPGLAAIEAAMLQDARSTAVRTGTGWYQVARIASLAGRGDEASEALGRACSGGEPLKVAAAGDLWLSRTLDPARIHALCGGESLQ